MMTKEEILEACKEAEAKGIRVSANSFYDLAPSDSATVYEYVCPLNACLLKMGRTPCARIRAISTALHVERLEVESFIEGVDGARRNPDGDNGIDGPAYMLGQDVRAALWPHLVSGK